MNRRDVLKSATLLLGYAVTPNTLTQLFRQAAMIPSADWTPVFFTPEDAALIAEITETILPKTGTPGAKELGVPAFIDLLLKDTMPQEGQQAFLDALHQLDADCKKAQGKGFIACSQTQREAYLLQLDRSAGPTPPTMWGITLGPPAQTNFFRQIKGLTLFGYYSNEKVGKEILRYDPIPGAYVSCMPLDGNAWSE